MVYVREDILLKKIDGFEIRKDILSIPIGVDIWHGHCTVDIKERNTHPESGEYNGPTATCRRKVVSTMRLEGYLTFMA